MNEHYTAKCCDAYYFIAVQSRVGVTDKRPKTATQPVHGSESEEADRSDKDSCDEDLGLESDDLGPQLVRDNNALRKKLRLEVSARYASCFIFNSLFRLTASSLGSA